VDDVAIVRRRAPAASPSRLAFNRQQHPQNTPLDLCQIAAAQSCLPESAALNQNEIHASMILSTRPKTIFVCAQLAVKLTELHKFCFVYLPGMSSLRVAARPLLSISAFRAKFGLGVIWLSEVRVGGLSGRRRHWCPRSDRGSL